MCCMWSTVDPPDIIEGTETMNDSEDAFDIEISDEEAMRLYDMDLDQPVERLDEILKQKSVEGR